MVKLAKKFISSYKDIICKNVFPLFIFICKNVSCYNKGHLCVLNLMRTVFHYLKLLDQISMDQHLPEPVRNKG